jgi:hypothetical protein
VFTVEIQRLQKKSASVGVVKLLVHQERLLLLLETGKWKLQAREKINFSHLPKKKRIGKRLVRVAYELQRPLKIYRDNLFLLISLASDVPTEAS